MYGKIFAAMYQGSMFGIGSRVFAVWGYAIANADARGYVELNPEYLAAVLGDTEKGVEEAIGILERPDPKSRNLECGGRRLVREGQFLYFMPSFHRYRSIMSTEDRREYWRLWKQQSRTKRKRGVPLPGEAVAVAAVKRGEDIGQLPAGVDLPAEVKDENEHTKELPDENSDGED